MSAETTGIPLVVRYNNQGQPDGLKEELNINVNSISALEYKGIEFVATSLNSVTSINDVSITGTLSDGQLLTYDSGFWINKTPAPGTPGSLAFTDLTDTPGSLTSDRLVVVNTGGTSLEYSTITRTQLEAFRNNINTLTNGQVILTGPNDDTFISKAFKFTELDDTQGVGLPNSGSKYILIDSGGLLSDATYSDTDVGQLITDLNLVEAEVDAIQFVSSLSAITIANIQPGEILVYEDATNGWVNTAQSTTAETVKINVRNETTGPISKGTVVYVNGVHGVAAKKLTIATAATNTPGLADKLLGVLNQDLDIQGEGTMTMVGHAEPFNTAITNIAVGSEGSPVFLDPNNPGLLTTTAPTKPNLILEVGILERRDSNNGEIFVRFLRTGVLNTLYNVNIPTPANDNIIIYDTTAGFYTQLGYTLANLKDTTITAPGNDDILVYTESGGGWINRKQTVGGLAADSPPDDNALISYNSSTSSFEAIIVDHGVLSGLTDDDHAQYVFKNNSTQARNTIQPTADVPALTLQAGSSNTGRLFDIKDSTAATVAYITIDGTIVTDGGLNVGGTKSFVIDHPTKEGMKLQYSCLEGPENGVYVRGRTESDVIDLPDYWVGLVHENSITVNLTPVGSAQSDLFVANIADNKVYLARESDQPINCFYTVNATRKDLDNLVVEFSA